MSGAQETGVAVLVVEDDEATAELERRALSRSGMTVHLATCVSEAVALLQKQSFAAVLLDYQLPDGHAWEVLEAAQSRTPRVPVVIVTAMGNERIAAEAIHRGVADYVTKSNTFWDELPNIVARVSGGAQLEELNRKLATIVDCSDDAIIGQTLEGIVTSWNRGAEAIFGYSAQEMIGKPISSLIPEQRRDEERNILEQLGAGKRVDHFETFRVRKGGGAVPVSVTLSPILDNAGRMTGAASIARDVTERLRSEEEIKRSQAQLAEAQAIAHVGSWDWEIAHNLVTWSDELYRICGLERGVFMPTFEGSLDRVHPEDRERARLIVHQGATDALPFAMEFRFVRPDGVARTVLARGRTITDAAGTSLRVTGTVEDITERKELQAQLIFSGRMASVGTLAAGVAHEINNPLSYVIANIELSIASMPELAARLDRLQAVVAHQLGAFNTQPLWGDEAPTQVAKDLRGLAEALSEAREGAHRVKHIVRDLKVFSHAEDQQHGPVQLRRLLETTINMAWNEVRHRARMVKDFGDVAPVDANEARLGQVFLNLLINAAQAIGEGSAEHNEIRVVTRMEEGRVVVEVHDTGCGIPQDKLDRIFDPFFTTKPVGVGVGLGLSICQTIIRSLGGQLSVESTQGRGSTFRVSLPPAVLEPTPVVLAPTSAARPEPASASSPRRRILIIDDEHLVLSTLQRVLRLDHDVVALSSAREALERLAAAEHFDLIVCDLMMPDMSGFELYEAMAQCVPDQLQRLIFLTGGAFTPRAQSFLDSVPNLRIDKPFSVVNLRTLINDLLRARLGTG